MQILHDAMRRQAMRYSLAVLGVLACALTPALAAAQQVSLLEVGTRVRVTSTNNAEPFTGSVLRLVADTLVVATEGGSALLTLPAPSIRKLEVSEGRDRVRWGFIGLGAGALAGGVGTAAAAGHDDSTGLGAFVGLIAGGVLGGALGGVVGAIAAPEEWREYPVPRIAGVRAP